MKLKNKIDSNKAKKQLLEDVDWFLINLMLLVGITGLLYLAVSKEKDAPNYFKAQSYLFVAVVISVTSFLVRKDVVKDMINTLKRVFKGIKIDLYEKGNILLTLSYLMALISIFAIDMSFMNNYGIKVSGVVAVNFYFMFKTFVFDKKRDR